MPTASKGLRAINLLGRREITEDDDMPPHLRSGALAYYFINKGVDSSFSRTGYFTGVFQDQ